MTKKPTLTNIASGFASNTQLNNNFQLLRDAFDNTLSLDGSTPNAMNADLDLNGNSINNVGDLGITGELTIDGQVVTSILTVPDWKGEWATGNAYALNDLVRYAGSAYIVKVAHTSGTFSADQSAGKLEVFAEKGSAGAGTGDMLTTNNLSDLTNKPQAIVNLGISATAAELNYVDGVTSNVQTQLDAKAPLASPALTGTPTAPTATAGDNTTKLATTAFVKTAVSGAVGYDAQIFYASGTWTKPAGAPSTAMVRFEIWGGGGGASRNTNFNGNGGGGGGYNEYTIVASSLGATETVTVGAGGLGKTTTYGSGADGGTSSFGIYGATGGAGGFGTNSGTNPGDDAGLGGGQAKSGTLIANKQGWTGGGGSVSFLQRNSLFGGGAGASYTDVAAGISLYGGNGGNQSSSGTIPAGGGGGGNNNTNGANGASGLVRVYTTW